MDSAIAVDITADNPQTEGESETEKTIEEGEAERAKQQLEPLS